MVRSENVKCPACGGRIRAPQDTLNWVEVRTTAEGHRFVRCAHSRCGLPIRAFLDCEAPVWEVDRSTR